MKKKIISGILAFSMILSISSVDGFASSTIGQTTNNKEFDSEEIIPISDVFEREKKQTIIDSMNQDKAQVIGNSFENANQSTLGGYIPKKLTNSGKINNIVILIKLKNSTGSNYFTYNENMINTIKESYTAPTNSLPDYYKNVSGGKIQINPIFPQMDGDKVTIYETPLEYTAYDNTDLNFGGEMLKDAFNSIKDKIPSDLDLDSDDDGFIDLVTFFVDRQSLAPFLYPHYYGVYPSVSLNGAKLYKYNLITTTQISSSKYKILAHEFGHALGFPDFYGSKYNIGLWSMMCNNVGYPTVYERSKYTTWVDESEIPAITKSGTYEISDATQDSSKNTIGYKIEIEGSEESFRIEYRNKEANIYENKINGTGLLVSRVKPSEEGNYYGDGEEEILMADGVKGVYDAALNDSSKNKTINLLLRDGTDTGYSVTYLSTSNGKVKFRVTNV